MKGQILGNERAWKVHWYPKFRRIGARSTIFEGLDSFEVSYVMLFSAQILGYMKAVLVPKVWGLGDPMLLYCPEP